MIKLAVIYDTVLRAIYNGEFLRPSLGDGLI